MFDHLDRSRYDIRTVQKLLGHKDVATTLFCTHVLQRGAGGVQSLSIGYSRACRSRLGRKALESSASTASAPLKPHPRGLLAADLRYLFCDLQS
jgi:hypothetical protein